MKTASTIDPSILPAPARRELVDFYRFLVDKYGTRQPTRRSHPAQPVQSAAASLASSAVVGIWKDRDLGDSSEFARSLRDKAQQRNLS